MINSILKRLMIVALGAAAFLWLDAANAQQPKPSVLDVVKARGTMIVGLRKDFPPAGFVDEKNEWVGYEIELSQYIANKLGVKLQRELVTSATRIPLLLNENIDVIMATMGPASERATVIDFTLPYIIAGTRVLTKTDSGIQSIADLAAPRKTGMAQGTTDDKLLLALQPKAVIVYYQQWPLAALALKQGRVDAVVTTDFTLEAMSKDDPSLHIVGPIVAPGGWAMGIRQNDSKWRTFLDITIGEAWADGTIAKLYTKYFGREPAFVLPVWREYLTPRN